jgi:DUF4097 and DUF4098 domain-containing protein YvlB
MEKTFETPDRVGLYVENEVGLVAVTAQETVVTTVSLIPETPGAEELVERATVECRPAGGGHLVTIKVPRLHGMRFLRSNAVTVRVTLPEGSDIKAVTASADVEVVGPVGSVDAKTASGDVSTDDVGGEVTAKVASGDVSVGSVGGNLRVHTASGDLRCPRVGGRAMFNTATGEMEIGSAGDWVEVKATSGHVRIGELARGARVVNVSGDVRVLAVAEGKLHVRSVSGSVAVGVVPGADLHVDVESLSGSVHSEIPLEEGRGARHGEPRVEISVRTVSGNVAIVRTVEAVV